MYMYARVPYSTNTNPDVRQCKVKLQEIPPVHKLLCVHTRHCNKNKNKKSQRLAVAREVTPIQVHTHAHAACYKKQNKNKNQHQTNQKKDLHSPSFLGGGRFRLGLVAGAAWKKGRELCWNGGLGLFLGFKQSRGGPSPAPGPASTPGTPVFRGNFG